MRPAPDPPLAGCFPRMGNKVKRGRKEKKKKKSPHGFLSGLLTEKREGKKGKKGRAPQDLFKVFLQLRPVHQLEPSGGRKKWEKEKGGREGRLPGPCSLRSIKFQSGEEREEGKGKKEKGGKEPSYQEIVLPVKTNASVRSEAKIETRKREEKKKKNSTPPLVQD